MDRFGFFLIFGSDFTQTKEKPGKTGYKDRKGNKRYTQFKSKGGSLFFLEVIDNDTIRVRTYERGVEDETLACGTGAVASSIIASLRVFDNAEKYKINVKTQGGEVLRVCFNRDNQNISNVWLEGKAQIVYKGEYYV